MRWIEERKDEGYVHGIEADGMHGKTLRDGYDKNVCVDEVDERARYDRVCNPCRRVGGHCHSGDCRVPSQSARTMGRHRGWYEQAVGVVSRSRMAFRYRVARSCHGKALLSERGQATVEFAVITAGFLAMMLALSAVWHAIGDGLLVDHAIAVASHHLQTAALATVSDIFLY